MAAADANREAAYRLRRIFYYAVEPFADNEMAEILDAAFHRPSPPARGDRHREIAQPLNSIAITNRNGTRVRLQIAPGLLRREEGLGRLIHQKLVAKLFPMESSPEEVAITPMNLVSIAQRCDRVIVLTTGDQGRCRAACSATPRASLFRSPAKAATKSWPWSCSPPAARAAS